MSASRSRKAAAVGVVGVPELEADPAAEPEPGVTAVTGTATETGGTAAVRRRARAPRPAGSESAGRLARAQAVPVRPLVQVRAGSVSAVRLARAQVVPARPLALVPAVQVSAARQVPGTVTATGTAMARPEPPAVLARVGLPAAAVPLPEPARAPAVRRLRAARDRRARLPGQATVVLRQPA